MSGWKVQAPPGVPDWLRVFTAAERPDLWEHVCSEHAFDQVWPEYNLHGNTRAVTSAPSTPATPISRPCWWTGVRASRQRRARTIPFAWDGTLADLPAGIDATGLRAVDGPGPANALSALAGEVLPAYQGGGLSKLIVEVMATMARSSGRPAAAPVRPNWKHRYPLMPIERYGAWKRSDGFPYDPWLRVHVRLGGRPIRCEPRSMEITAPVPDWEAWTRMIFPESGCYVFPEGLAPLTVDDGLGTYWEPNVWLLHDI